MTTIYQPPMYDRLEQITPWDGGMLAGSDMVTLADAARFASKHAKTEITPADFLRAAGRGQIQMRAISPRAATMEPCRENDEPLNRSENSIPTLPLDACKSLSNTGRAAWRTIDGFEPADSFAGALCRFTRWKLPDTEPDILTTPDDCRLTGCDVHTLADAFIEAPAQTATTAPVVTDGDGLAPLTTAPSWSLITPPERTPGYRWPLYQFLREAHVAGKPRPKAQEVLDAWKMNPPSGLKVIKSCRRDALEYELNNGQKKTADLKAIQAAIDGLVIQID